VAAQPPNSSQLTDTTESNYIQVNQTTMDILCTAGVAQPQPINGPANGVPKYLIPQHMYARYITHVSGGNENMTDTSCPIDPSLLDSTAQTAVATAHMAEAQIGAATAQVGAATAQMGAATAHTAAAQMGAAIAHTAAAQMGAATAHMAAAQTAVAVAMAGRGYIPRNDLCNNGELARNECQQMTPPPSQSTQLLHTLVSMLVTQSAARCS
jgi:hypothetical protein